MFRLFTTIAVIILVGLRVQAQDIPAPASDSTAVPAAVADTVARTQWYENGLIGKVYRYFKNSNKQRKKNFDISFIGGPHYSSEEGFGIGLAASGIYSAGGLQDTITPLSNITLKADATTGQMFKIGIEGYHIFVGDRYRFNYDVSFYSFKDKMWGIGYLENKADSSQNWYRRLQSEAKVDIVFQVSPNIFVGPKAEFAYINAHSFEKPWQLEGQSNRTFNTGVGITFLYDTRDIPTAATKGWNIRLDLIANPRFLANKYDFTKVELNASAYQQVWKGGVLAENLHSRHTWGDTPWGLMSTFGGSHTMRGYWEGRYRDKMATSVTVELRQHVWRRNGIAVWVGAGTVYPRFSALRLSHILPNAGIGYRWEFKKGVNVRLDVGFGRGEKSFNFSLNEAF